ncbi:fibronectin type III domain protein [Desulfocucumis palustris]|uniref:Fibronectin type III domain protein n=1 Tax=Desulfocucumis palustris TaxID=1898651 RepID=A0A2L2XLZ9_9FIRM|nr:SwmB domain-containing protein [Desulfocucumis palustris]GBF35336.1 fibronectin type III domain protein [Desulfocucumis palustris]
MAKKPRNPWCIRYANIGYYHRNTVCLSANPAAVTVEANQTENVALTAEKDGEVVEGVDYDVTSADETVATATEADGVITVTGVREGSTELTVTAAKEGEEFAAIAPIAVTVTEGTIATVEITGAASVPVGTSVDLTAVAKDAGGNVIADAGAVTWAITSDNADNAVLTQSGKFIATVAGSYTVTATIGAVVGTATIQVSGIAAGVTFTASKTSVVANATDTADITVSVVDTNGNVVTNFNGTAAPQRTPVAGAQAVAVPATVTITNGVGTFTATSFAAGSIGTDSLSITVGTLVSTNGQPIATSLNYGNVQVSSVARTATALTLSGPAYVSANGNTQATLNVGYADQNGAAMNAPAAQYVTYTLTGPASFQQGGAPVTTQSVFVPAAGGTVNIFAIMGQTGAITLTASAAGLTTATAQIQSVINTAATDITVTSETATLTAVCNADNAGTNLPAGTAFNRITIQLVDTNGLPVAGTDALNISDNTTAASSLYYWTVNANGQPGVYLGTTPQVSALVGGRLQLAVLNTAVAATSPTITVRDTVLNVAKTTTYSYVTSSASTATWVGQAIQTAMAGQSVTLTLQLQDIAGNDLQIANRNVPVYFLANAANATIAGSSAWTVLNPYNVTTNAQGQATVTVAVPAASAGSAFTLTSALTGGVPAVVTVTAVNASAYATGLVLANTAVAAGSIPNPTTEVITWPNGNMTAGQNLAAFVGSAINVLPVNAIGQVANATDVIRVTSSNENVLDIAGVTNGFVEGPFAVGPVPAITAVNSGTATLTFTNVTNPAVPAVTKTITVVPATAPAAVLGMNPDGTTNRVYNFTTAGVVGPFTLQAVDGGNNLVAATVPITLTAVQVDNILGTPGTPGIRTSAAGSNVTSVTIPQGQASVQIWVDGITLPSATAATAAVALNTLAPEIVSAAINGDTLVVTMNNPVTGTATAAAFDVVIDAAPAVNPTGDGVISGNTITLTLAAPVTNANVVTLAYTTDSFLTTGYQAPLATTIAPIAVTNNTP